MDKKERFGTAAGTVARRTSRRKRKNSSVGNNRTWWQNAGNLFIAYECLMLASPAQAVDVCIPEHFLYTPKEGPDTCLRCFPGAFMPHHLHTHRQCFECSKVQDSQLEIVVSPCTLQKDTEIHCAHGYYRTKSIYPHIRGHCEKCTTCPFPKGPCQTFRDTICCPGEDFAVRTNREGNAECVRLCGPGQFLEPTVGQCFPCPANTFMHEDRHTHIYCWNCNVPSSEHQVIVQPCTSTQPAVIGCQKGYYRQSSQIFPFEGCAKCQVCSENSSGHVFEARPCRASGDAVCCAEADMIVVDTAEGPKCQHPVTTSSTTVARETESGIGISMRSCGKGEYLSIDLSIASTICLPCPAGTCMTETEHFKTACLACDNLEDEMKFTGLDNAKSPAIWKSTDCAVILFCLVVSAMLITPPILFFL